MLQILITALLVVGCACYALWTLMPATLRRRAATAALACPLPESLAAPLRRIAAAQTGCGCDGCDHSAAKPKAPAVTPITFHRRPRS